MKLTQSDLKIARELAENATPGPWLCEFDHHKAFLGESRFKVVTPLKSVVDERTLICQAWLPEAEFIAHVNPQFLLTLLNQYEEALRVISFYGNKENWTQNYSTPITEYATRPSIRPEDICDSSGGKLAREFLKGVSDES